MYRAKGTGKGRAELFDPCLEQSAVERLEIESDLRHAIERGEMRVLYQPVVELSTGEISGMEALVRWQHPTRGLLSPDAFVAVAEETGVIVAVGQWVLEEACASWPLMTSALATHR